LVNQKNNIYSIMIFTFHDVIFDVFCCFNWLWMPILVYNNELFGQIVFRKKYNGSLHHIKSVIYYFLSQYTVNSLFLYMLITRKMPKSANFNTRWHFQSFKCEKIPFVTYVTDQTFKNFQFGKIYHKNIFYNIDQTCISLSKTNSSNENENSQDNKQDYRNRSV
jgi:hypothetical protein